MMLFMTLHLLTRSKSYPRPYLSFLLCLMLTLLLFSSVLTNRLLVSAEMSMIKITLMNSMNLTACHKRKTLLPRVVWAWMDFLINIKLAWTLTCVKKMSSWNALTSMVGRILWKRLKSYPVSSINKLRLILLISKNKFQPLVLYQLLNLNLELKETKLWRESKNWLTLMKSKTKLMDTLKPTLKCLKREI